MKDDFLKSGDENKMPEYTAAAAAIKARMVV
ncbi:hypothetical protein FHW67_004139 [Herbaspirillum sp. Sphag1AN]|nr:hypothetical protein [Herbaspirillum sp. Sphag1AN]